MATKTKSKPIPYSDAEKQVLRDLVSQDKFTIKETAAKFREQFPQRPEVGVMDKVRQTRRDVFPARYPKTNAKKNGNGHTKLKGPGLAKVTSDLVDATDALLYSEENGNMPDNVRGFVRERARDTVKSARKALKQSA